MCKTDQMKHLLTAIACFFALCISAQEYPEVLTHYGADMNDDGIVGMADLLYLLLEWGIDYDAAVAAADSAALAAPCDIMEYNGYTYELVEIGEQCWFAENLQTTLFNNGDPIDYEGTNSLWESAIYPLYSPPYGNWLLVEYYGLLYNGYTVLTENICPTNWRIPSHEDFIELNGGNAVDNPLDSLGTKLKNSFSDIPPWNGQNVFGFGLVRAGARLFSGEYVNDNGTRFWLTDGESSAWTNSTVLNFSAFPSDYDSYVYQLAFGKSIRCIKN